MNNLNINYNDSDDDFIFINFSDSLNYNTNLDISNNINNIDNTINNIDNTNNNLDISNNNLDISDNKIQNNDNKIQNSDNKIQNSDNKIQNSDNKIQNSDNKIDNSDNKIQNSDNKIDNSDNKIEIKIEENNNNFEENKIKINKLFIEYKKENINIIEEIINEIHKKNNILEMINILYNIYTNICINKNKDCNKIFESIFYNIIVINKYIDLSVFNLYLKTFCNQKFTNNYNLKSIYNIQILLIISEHIPKANYIYFLNNMISSNTKYLFNFIIKSPNKNNNYKLVNALFLYYKYELDFNELYNNLLIFISLNIYEAYYYLSLFENNPKYNQELLLIGSDNDNITCSIALAEFYKNNNNSFNSLNLLSKSLLLEKDNNRKIIIKEIIDSISNTHKNNKINNNYINNLFDKIFCK